MKKEREPKVKDFKGMNIVNSLIYHKEALKREKDPEKAELLQIKFDKLKIELEHYKVA